MTADFDTLNYLADYMRDKQKAQVDELKRSGTKVAFADPVPAFKGHGICDSNEKPGTNTCLSLESFHPKNDGTTGYAKVMDQELADIGYKGD
ncbi:hypothetical protein ACFV2N_31245 [Streptomyces sp. NPDC059680]|uniref:hypothetical protein n=1 Tax=Streptomyces sp. NPDC059680 TaxID=3346904 RepID=UPI0036834EF4